MNRIGAILVTAALLVGCSGAMNGMIRDDGSRVPISYEQGMDHDKLRVTMPDGETFTGKAVMVGASSAFVSGYAYGTAPSFAVVNTYNGNIQAVLFGDRGHTRRCNFQYADSSGFTTAGGVGLCETSDERVIDVQW